MKSWIQAFKVIHIFRINVIATYYYLFYFLLSRSKTKIYHSCKGQVILVCLSDDLFGFVGPSSEECCQDAPGMIKSCQNIVINPVVLKKKSLNIANTSYSFTNDLPPNGFAFHAKDGSEAVINHNVANENVFGSITTPEGHMAIEKCKDNHVLKTYHLMKQVNTNDTAGCHFKFFKPQPGFNRNSGIFLCPSFSQSVTKPFEPLLGTPRHS